MLEHLLFMAIGLGVGLIYPKVKAEIATAYAQVKADVAKEEAAVTGVEAEVKKIL